jgi:hypothetical protein
MESETPQHIAVKNGMQRCVLLPDGRFHLVTPGPLVDLFYGGSHILVSESLASVLREVCPHCAEFRPTELVQIATGEKFGTYYQVLPHEEFTPEDIESVRTSGPHAWHFRGAHLFVSPKVAAIIRQRGFKELSFSLAFSEFAGAEA